MYPTPTVATHTNAYHSGEAASIQHPVHLCARSLLYGFTHMINSNDFFLTRTGEVLQQEGLARGSIGPKTARGCGHRYIARCMYTIDETGDGFGL